MLTLARAYLEVADYLSMAKFDDPDVGQGAIEYLNTILSEGSNADVLDLFSTVKILISDNESSSNFLLGFYKEAKSEVMERGLLI